MVNDKWPALSIDIQLLSMPDLFNAMLIYLMFSLRVLEILASNQVSGNTMFFCRTK